MPDTHTASHADSLAEEVARFEAELQRRLVHAELLRIKLLAANTPCPGISG